MWVCRGHSYRSFAWSISTVKRGCWTEVTIWHNTDWTRTKTLLMRTSKNTIATLEAGMSTNPTSLYWSLLELPAIIGCMNDLKALHREKGMQRRSLELHESQNSTTWSTRDSGIDKTRPYIKLSTFFHFSLNRSVNHFLLRMYRSGFCTAGGHLCYHDSFCTTATKIGRAKGN
jgi:hypothetical protein